jgi:hypothetical protein
MGVLVAVASCSSELVAVASCSSELVAVAFCSSESVTLTQSGKRITVKKELGY